MLSAFLQQVARKYGPEALEAAMVFVKLDRPFDEMVAWAHANSAPHRGAPSPWSHCFLVAEPYSGSATKILDCTIRDQSGKVDWDLPLANMLQQCLARSDGQVYGGVVSDYDDARVAARGVMWLPGLHADERRDILVQARLSQQRGVRFSLPEPLRKLSCLVLGLGEPSASSGMFSSTFVQKAYREALGIVGDFAIGLRDEDTTLDDIWYSHKGLAIADVRADWKAKAHGDADAVLRLYANSAARIASSEATESADLSGRTAEARKKLQDALTKLAAVAADGKTLPDLQSVRAVLEKALTQLNRSSASGVLSQSTALLHNDDMELSLVLSALSEDAQPTTVARLFGSDIVGFKQYENLDLRWVASAWNRVTRSKVPFPPPCFEQLVQTIPDEFTMALAGDWGTGTSSSRAIKDQIEKLSPDYTLHLGDVYYSGSESEELNNFVSIWPAGKLGSFALNSNHEMYSGGHGYFGVALSNTKFRKQKGYSYFALTNDAWLLVGFDSAYGGAGLYEEGVLNKQQLDWATWLFKSDFARSHGSFKNIAIFTHHQPMDFDGVKNRLFNQVTAVIGRGPHRWYWGHVHGVAVFNPIRVGFVDFRGRLIGHGGIPFTPDKKTAAIEWTETELANDPALPSRARNGFALLKFTPYDLEETIRDEFGHVRWRG